jgi:hypothetical protein
MDSTMGLSAAAVARLIGLVYFFMKKSLSTNELQKTPSEKNCSQLFVW